MATAKRSEKAQETPIRRSLRNASKPKPQTHEDVTPSKAKASTSKQMKDEMYCDETLEDTVDVTEDDVTEDDTEDIELEEAMDTGDGTVDETLPDTADESGQSVDGEEDDEENGFPANSNMSLDVLARVATETLDKFKSSKLRLSPRKKVIRKTAPQAMDTMTLTQIQNLTDKVLVSLFSESVCNEMSRNFTYTCYLMPRKCKEKFTSFGLENRARSQMRSHLVKHVAILVDEANDPEKTPEAEFTAETVPGRRRRLTAAVEGMKLQKKRNFPLFKPKKPDYTVIKPHKDAMLRLTKGTFMKAHRKSPKKVPIKPPVRVKTTQFPGQKVKVQPHLIPTDPGVADDANVVDEVTVEEISDISEFITIKDESLPSEMTSIYQEEAERRIEENEQFIIELLCRSQPHHDHCYTTIFGKKRGVELMTVSDSEEEEETEPNVLAPPVLPMLLFSCDLVPPPDIGPIASQEVIIEEEVIMMPVSVVTPPAPWQWQSLPDAQPIYIGEEEKPTVSAPAPVPAKRSRPTPKPQPSRPPPAQSQSSESAQVIAVYDPVAVSVSRRQRKPQENYGNSEWERRMALRCINELQGRKKDDKVPLMCQICATDRIFTAATTLTYHYRSHAGIKPFVCLICNTTFTRQHSLNYHMLIHNNQSRFTCKDCGRQFRHPSHFKEHLRRHTGETPYECMDCLQRFKTRNTFKRHLKTRHGKLLTADGIHYLTNDEFLRVRTNPKRNLTESIIYLESGLTQVISETLEEPVEEPSIHPPTLLTHHLHQPISLIHQPISPPAQITTPIHPQVISETLEPVEQQQTIEEHTIEEQTMEEQSVEEEQYVVEEEQSIDEDEMATDNLDLLTVTEEEAKAVLEPIIQLSMPPNMSVHNIPTHIVQNMHSIPMQNIPIQNIPIQNIPMQNIPMHYEGVQEFTVEDIQYNNASMQMQASMVAMQEINAAVATVSDV